jgi:hypothetical protein
MNLGRSDSQDRSCARPGQGAEGEIRKGRNAWNTAMTNVLPSQRLAQTMAATVRLSSP